jgi:excisionase family DNA binding protein
VTITAGGDGLLDCEEAAAILHCTPRFIRKLVDTRQIDSIKVGRLVRIERAAVDQYVERNRRPAALWP